MIASIFHIGVRMKLNGIPFKNGLEKYLVQFRLSDGTVDNSYIYLGIFLGSYCYYDKAEQDKIDAILQEALPYEPLYILNKNDMSIYTGQQLKYLNDRYNINFKEYLRITNLDTFEVYNNVESVREFFNQL